MESTEIATILGEEAETKFHQYIEGKDAIVYSKSALLTCPRGPPAKYAKGLFQSCLLVLRNLTFTQNSSMVYLHSAHQSEKSDSI